MSGALVLAAIRSASIKVRHGQGAKQPVPVGITTISIQTTSGATFQTGALLAIIPGAPGQHPILTLAEPISESALITPFPSLAHPPVHSVQFVRERAPSWRLA